MNKWTYTGGVVSIQKQAGKAFESMRYLQD